jgi:hypothetical protein
MGSWQLGIKGSRQWAVGSREEIMKMQEERRGSRQWAVEKNE